MLDERVREEVLSHHARLLAEGELLAPEVLAGFRSLFAERFGPQVLAGLDGEALLSAMHDHSTPDSLVYWLEYKNDDEFPTVLFGGIAGGSALKFGIYRRKDTGRWMAGHPTAQKVLSEEEAVVRARAHRDQFLAGAEVLQRFAALDPEVRDYGELQHEMVRLAPDVAESAWGHKYFALLFPELLDDFHSVEHQRFHLIKLLVPPPEQKGRYVCGGAFAAIARELELDTNHLTGALNARDGNPHGYWRIGTSFGDEPRSEWPTMRAEGFVGVGWRRLGDLSDITGDKAGRELLQERVVQAYPEYSPQYAGRATAQLFRFVMQRVEPGDLAVAMDGATVLGVGRITGEYRYVPGESFYHRREVEWLSSEEWKLPESEGLRTTLHELRKPDNLLEVERRVMAGVLAPVEPSAQRAPATSSGQTRAAPLAGLPAAIAAALERKGQVILYGPPGTGKTHWALITARELLARSRFGRALGELSAEQRASLRVPLCTFHPAYGYEDFLEGYRPVEQDGQLRFERRDGVFKALCEAARSDPRPHLLVIDEINRGDIPRIFGELLTGLELGKRGLPITLPLSGAPFAVPPNVRLIGTMNTADRSIALLDTALRRRFAFVELMPDSKVLGDAAVAGIPLGPWLDALNERIRQSLGRDARNLQVGHSFLLHEGRPITRFSQLVAVLRHDIVPLLQEYCYEDAQALEQILGSGLWDRRGQEVRGGLLSVTRREALVQALLSPCPEIAATEQAAAADAMALMEEAEAAAESGDADDAGQLAAAESGAGEVQSAAGGSAAVAPEGQAPGEPA